MSALCYIINLADKKEVDMSDKKMGRPTDNPKNRRITFRLDDTTFNNLETYCKNNNITKVEAIRKAINLLAK